MKQFDESAKRAHRIYVEAMDGRTYGAEDFSEVVRQMRADAWGGDASDGVRGYMRQVAKRISDWSAKAIRVSTPEMFLRDMAKEGLIQLKVKEAR